MVEESNDGFYRWNIDGHTDEHHKTDFTGFGGMNDQ